MNPLMYAPHNPHFPVVNYLPGPLHRRVHDEEDLASVALQIQRKRFYVDVKKNRRGIFMKIAEVGADGRKARILLTLSAAAELKNKLKDLIDVLDEAVKKEEDESIVKLEDKSSEPDKSPENTHNDGLIKSHILNYPYRRYFLDLKKNKRGHFLRLTMLSTINRVQLAVPSQGMLDLYNAISGLLDKWWDGSEAEPQKESKSLRVDNRTLYFDSSSNRFGTYLRISEVRTTSRTAITIPSRALIRFRDIINGLAEDMENAKVSESPNEQSSPTVENTEESSPTADGDAPS